MERSIGEMRVLRLSMQFAAFVMLFLFMACSTAPTKFSAVWKDEAYQERPGKILVINAVKDHTVRRLYEDELVKALKERKIDAIVSYTNMSDKMVADKNPIATQANTLDNMPDPIVSDKKTIATQAYAVGADTVLISKPRGRQIEDSINVATGFPIEDGDLYINLQTDVYDMKSNRLVLTVLAEIWIREREPFAKIIESHVKDLVHELSRLGLF
jgi:hypothetical protein